MDEQLLPTPYVGLPVIWYRDDQNIKDPIAATVTRVEGPGKVSLCYVPFNGHLAHVSGVNWVGNNRRIAPGRPFRRNGVWEFLADLKPRMSTKYHKDVIAKREAAAKAAARQEEARKQALLQQHEDAKANV